MTDRELLENAAKAVGGGAWHPLTHDTPNGRWDPLTDDGDALRLAVKRRFHVCIFSATDGDIKTPGFVEVWQEMDTDPLHVEYAEGADYEAATRRAIVRAAAAIGAAKNDRHHRPNRKAARQRPRHQLGRRRHGLGL